MEKPFNQEIKMYCQLMYQNTKLNMDIAFCFYYLHLNYNEVLKNKSKFSEYLNCIYNNYLTA